MSTFNNLPKPFQSADVMFYYELLQKKKVSLILKRVFDFTVSLLMLVIISPILLVIGIIIRLDSKGAAVFKQERITQYGRSFYIYKFRTMYTGSERGSQVTLKNDRRVTRIGKFLRKYRLDELLQLVNILKGDMSFVGTRPEVKKYVNLYTDRMYATLLLPAGVTSLASIEYKDEDTLLASADNSDETYVNEILPEKMRYNLEYIEKFNFFFDLKIMFMTVSAVFGKDSAANKETGENADVNVNANEKRDEVKINV